MRFRVSAAGIVLAVIVAAPVAAQQPGQPTIAQLARQAEAAKATAKKAKKTYTNADLSADPRSEPANEAAPKDGFMSTTLGKPISAVEMVKRSEEKADLETGATQPESHWRQRADSLRMQIGQLQPRLAALSQPNPKRDANPGMKASNDAEIASIRQGLAGLEKQWARLEESARVARINLEWLEPRPVFEQ